MATTAREDFHAELSAWLDGVKAEQGATVRLRHITIPADADRPTLEAAMTALSVRKAKAIIPSTAAEYQADIDALTDRWSALGG